MKSLVLFFTCLFFACSSIAQSVSLNKKGNTVSIDGNAVLKYKKKQLVNYSFYNLNGDELLYFTYINNGTPDYNQDDYFIITFIEQNIKVESNNYAYIQTFFNFNKSMEKLVSWLLEEKVMNLDGTINSEKVFTFHTKYDQSITNRTIRY